jgi:hypothetical protein
MAADTQPSAPTQQSVSVVPQATYDTALTHDLHPLQFAGVLTILGLIWFTIPGRYHWPMAGALILGSSLLCERCCRQRRQAAARYTVF